MINASPDGYHGPGSGRATPRQAAAIAAPRPCARRPSPFSQGATRRSGRRSPRHGWRGAQAPHAQTVAGFIRDHGASFFDELVDGARLLRPQVEAALGELVALGLVTSDSFGGCGLCCAVGRRPFAAASGGGPP